MARSAKTDSAARKTKVGKLRKPTKEKQARPATQVGANMRSGRPKASRPTADFEWIKHRCAELGLTQADLARALRRDSSMITRSLQGSRAFDGNDIAGLASALQVSTDEVHRRLGHPVPSAGVVIVGKITGDAKVSTVSARKGGRVRAIDIPAGAEAYVAETHGSPLEAFAGAHFIAAAVNHDAPVPPDSFGRLCIVEADVHLVPMLGTLGKATQRGHVMLTLFGSGEQITVQHVHRASPVLAIIFN